MTRRAARRRTAARPAAMPPATAACYHRRAMTPSDRPRPPRRALLAAPLLLAAALATGAVALAQSTRPIPANAEVGRLRIGVFPEATLDGRAIRLGPGTRIYDDRNMISPPGGIVGERKVAFVRGTIGEVTQVWLLNDAEFREISNRIAAARRSGAR
jgi:hypothetical protein